jgi:hypothetical protein
MHQSCSGGVVVSATVEPLEPRRLLAADIAVSRDMFVFNDPVGGGASASQRVRLHNTGDATLHIPAGGISIGGAHAQNFFLTIAPTTPASIPAGQFLDVRVAFRASGLGPRHARLHVQSNDPDTPNLDISLRGLGTKGLFSSNEPSLQWILDTYNIPVNVGDNDPTTNVMPVPPIAGNEEIRAPFLRKAGPGPVTIEMLAMFTGEADPAGRFGFHTTGGGALQQTFVVHRDDVQTLNPRTIGNTSFDPGNATFGVFSTWPSFGDRAAFSHDERNTWETNAAMRQKYRFYPLKNPDGTTQMDALIVGVEEAANADFQDAVFIIRNVRPNVSPAAPTGIVATAQSPTSIQVTWNDNADNEYGYLIERSRNKNGTYMELAAVGVNRSGFLDTALRPDTRYFYRVRAISPAGNSDHTGRTSARTPPRVNVTSSFASSSASSFTFARTDESNVLDLDRLLQFA